MRRQQLNESFGKTLAWIRQNNGLSQEEVASYLHIHRTTVAKIEHGVRTLSCTEMAYYAEAIGIGKRRFYESLLQVNAEFEGMDYDEFMRSTRPVPRRRLGQEGQDMRDFFDPEGDIEDYVEDFDVDEEYDATFGVMGYGEAEDASHLPSAP